MKLRSKLLLVALTLLLLPWAGLLILQAFEGMLRQTAEKSGLEAAKAPALLLATDKEFFNRDRAIYRPMALTDAISLDGSLNEWPALITLNNQVSYAIAADDLAVTVAVTMRGQAPSWLRSNLPFELADHLILQTNRKEYRIAANEPGRIRAWKINGNQATVSRETRIRGYWQAALGQQTFEVRIPKILIAGKTSLKLARPSSEKVSLIKRKKLVYPNTKIGEWLGALSAIGSITVVDHTGLQVLKSVTAQEALQMDDEFSGFSTAESVDSQQNINQNYSETLSLGERIMYRLLVENPPPVLEPADIVTQKEKLLSSALTGRPTNAWWQIKDFGKAWLGSAAPIRDQNGQIVGAILISQTDDAVQGFTNRALTRLGFITLAAFAAAALLLIIMATLLSWRIRRLSHAADHAVTDDGRFRPFKPSRSKDEIGDLSRSFAKMLHDLQSYTDYLRDLADKLSHELRTPLAIVRSSLDNLDHTLDGALDKNESTTTAKRYSERARDGAVRLSAILNAMSAAKHIEQAINTAEAETFNLADLVNSMALAYRDTWPQQTIELICPKQAPFFGMPELLAQALDKLVDNARDFCQKPHSKITAHTSAQTGAQTSAQTSSQANAQNGKIVIALELSEQEYSLSVYNEGPPLPDHMQGRLFDSMVSLREHNSDAAPHLGLGLYIVRLIAEAHGGLVTTKNEHNGVTFVISLPNLKT